MGQEINKIYELFESSCLELFDSLECDVQQSRDDPCPIGVATTSSIDAGSADIEFLLAISMPREVLLKTLPASELNAAEVELEDWLGEMANRLVGKFKSALMKHDCLVQIGLPQLHFGDQLEEIIAEVSESRIFEFVIDDEPFLTGLTIEILNSGLKFDIQGSESQDGVDDGELELF